MDETQYEIIKSLKVEDSIANGVGNHKGQSEGKTIPNGIYGVLIEELKLKAFHKGVPMISCIMKIFEGQYINKKIKSSQLVATSIGVYKANAFLKSLESGFEVEFNNFSQYGELIMDISEAAMVKGHKFIVNYKNSEGLGKIEIMQVIY